MKKKIEWKTPGGELHTIPEGAAVKFTLSDEKGDVVFTELSFSKDAQDDSPVISLNSKHRLQRFGKPFRRIFGRKLSIDIIK